MFVLVYFGGLFKISLNIWLFLTFGLSTGPGGLVLLV